MDLASIVGLVACLFFVVFGIVSGDQGVAALGNFWDATSVLITFGGAFMCVMTMSDSIPDFIGKLKSITLIFKQLPSNEEETIKNIINLSNVARKEGLLALEEAANSVEDAF